MSESLPVGLYKGVSMLTNEYVPFYNEGGVYGWFEYGKYLQWKDEKPQWSTGWFQSAVRWIDLVPSNELEFLVMTGKEFKVPDGA